MKIDSEFLWMLVKDGKIIANELTVNCNPATYEFIYTNNAGEQFIVEPI